MCIRDSAVPLPTCHKRHKLYIISYVFQINLLCHLCLAAFENFSAIASQVPDSGIPQPPQNRTTCGMVWDSSPTIWMDIVSAPRVLDAYFNLSILKPILKPKLCHTLCKKIKFFAHISGVKMDTLHTCVVNSILRNKGA